jgi:hypothetical protein
MEKHITATHDYHDREYSEPVPQWAASGHQESLVRCIRQGRISTAGWIDPSGQPWKGDPESASGAGCVMGFAMKRTYDCIGHQWAFMSMTLNPTIFDGGAIPKEWATVIWEATKDLMGNIQVLQGAVKLPVVERFAPPPPPPK